MSTRTSKAAAGDNANASGTTSFDVCGFADKFAENLLLTEAEECEIICCGHFAEKRCVEYFSNVFHVRPGVIVSRLQQQNKIPAHSPLNRLKIAV